MSDDDRCGARNRQGGTCRRRPMRGQKRCDMHGAKAPQALVAARRRAIEAEAAQAAARHEVNADINPLRALQQLAAEVLVFKNYLRSQVAQMEELIADNRLTGTDDVRALVTLYERALDRSSRILVDIARLNIDERLMKISRAHGDHIAWVIEAVLTEYQLAFTSDAVRMSVVRAMDRVAVPAEESTR
jgi:hypothetical protein